jgi:predicted nucleotide-binding protein
VHFAVVLLTADDRGGTMKTAYDAQKPRARQNVILELGFFLGKLGRKRVCAIYQEGVEIPSDYSGVVFVPLDADGAWRMKLTRELKAAGLEVDMNRAV